MYRFRGLIDVAGEVVIAGLILVVLTLVFLVLDTAIGQKLIGTTTVQVDIRPVDDGTKINSLLLADSGEGRYAEVLGLMAAAGFSGQGMGITDAAAKVGLSLVVTDGTKKVFEVGDAMSEAAISMDFPLPGLKRGALGIGAFSGVES